MCLGTSCKMPFVNHAPLPVCSPPQLASPLHTHNLSIFSEVLSSGLVLSLFSLTCFTLPSWLHFLIMCPSSVQPPYMPSPTTFLIPLPLRHLCVNIYCYHSALPTSQRSFGLRSLRACVFGHILHAALCKPCATACVLFFTNCQAFAYTHPQRFLSVLCFGLVLLLFTFTCFRWPFGCTF